ncbi:MAG: DUF3168 domain-containing protein [Chloroflexi bacterium]|nr:DUF3168 domain-containing protein [Chloroflexota bacterium]
MNAVAAALATKLAGLAGSTGVYNTLAKPGAAFPYVVFALSSGASEDTNTKDGDRLLYDVKAIDNALSPKAAGDIAALVDAALHLQSLSITGWTCVQVRRVARFTYFDGEAWHVGGTYEVLTEKS